MKRNCSSPKKKPSFLSYLGTFFLFYLLFALIGTITYGSIHPGTEKVPEPYSSIIIKAASVAALGAVALKATIPLIRQFFFNKKDLSDEEKQIRAAMDIVFETGQASVSMLQRHLNIDYAQGEKIIQALESRGWISPYNGFQPRTILISESKWRKLRIK